MHGKEEERRGGALLSVGDSLELRHDSGRVHIQVHGTVCRGRGWICDRHGASVRIHRHGLAGRERVGGLHFSFLFLARQQDPVLLRFQKGSENATTRCVTPRGAAAPVGSLTRGSVPLGDQENNSQVYLQRTSIGPQRRRKEKDERGEMVDAWHVRRARTSTHCP